MHMVTQLGVDARRTYVFLRTSLILDLEKRNFVYTNTMIEPTYPRKMTNITQLNRTEMQSSLPRASINPARRYIL